jgi:hypothetical protein
MRTRSASPTWPPTGYRWPTRHTGYEIFQKKQDGRIVSPMAPGQRERFAASVSCFLDACFTEITSRAAGRVLDYETSCAPAATALAARCTFYSPSTGCRLT